MLACVCNVATVVCHVGVCVLRWCVCVCHVGVCVRHVVVCVRCWCVCRFSVSCILACLSWWRVCGMCVWHLGMVLRAACCEALCTLARVGPLSLVLQSLVCVLQLFVCVLQLLVCVLQSLVCVLQLLVWVSALSCAQWCVWVCTHSFVNVECSEWDGYLGGSMISVNVADDCHVTQATVSGDSGHDWPGCEYL